MKPAWIGVAMMAVLGLVFVSAEVIVNATDNPQTVDHPAGKILAVNFAHEDHIDQNCVLCHHNFVDDTGLGMCFDCHITDPEVQDLMEEQFHDLCRGCHEEKQNEQDEYGPTRSCLACHVTDDRP